MLVLEGEGVGAPGGLEAGRAGPGARGTGTVHQGAHRIGVVGPADRGVHDDLRRRAVRGLDQGPQVDAEGGGLLLHHAGQLPASDNGKDRCAHTLRLPAGRRLLPTTPYAGRRAQPFAPLPAPRLRAAAQ